MLKMSKEMKFTAFYNVFVTEHCKKLVVFGWMNESGRKPVLQVIDAAYHLSFITDGTLKNRVFTPFITSIDILDEPKSIQVIDGHDDFQIRIHNVETGGSGENEPGRWVISE
jgi:hypothetical protein